MVATGEVMEWIYGFIILIIVVLIFILIREFVCWYFKINVIVKLLEKIANDKPGR